MDKLRAFIKGKRIALRKYLESGKLVKQITILITLLTMGVVILLAWVIRPDPRITDAATELALTANNIRMFYQTKPGYWGLNTDMVIKNNLQASSMLVDGKLKNAFGKPVIIGQDTNGSIIMPGTRHFTITFPDLTAKECTAMAAFRLNERESLSLLQMVIITGDKTYEFNWGGTNPLPITKTEAAKYCGQQNTIGWSFE